MFTMQWYRNLLNLLKKEGYEFRSYHDYGEFARCVILRHDIDNSLDQAVRMAELETEEGVCSTWFVLLRTDFYNVASRTSLDKLRRIQRYGHELGLHFDEAAYGPALTPEEIPDSILKECTLLSDILGSPVKTVSIHRPSQAALEADYHIPGLVNSHGKIFFHDFKYLSDSRRRWREPVEDIIRSKAYDRLHILTHAFWYHEKDQDIARTVDDFIRAASGERCRRMAENITDIAGILGADYPLLADDIIRGME